MTDKEIQTLMELQAINTAKKVVEEFKPSFKLMANDAADAAIAKAQHAWTLDIENHSLKCSNKRMAAILGGAFGLICSVIAIVAKWAWQKLAS